MPPTVSVIMPVYNAERYIASAVRSVLDQTFRDFEFIIINDGSTDGSEKILTDLANEDSRITLITRANTGYVIALNEAIAMAKGEYLARMDADDLCLPRRFEKQIDYLTKHPEISLLGTQVVTIDEDGMPIGEMPSIKSGHEQIDRDLMMRGWPLVHPSIMMRTDAVRKVGGYVVELCPNEDHDLFLKMAEVGQVENLPEVLFHYRKHSSSISTTTKMERMAMLVEKIIVDACRRRGIPIPMELAQREIKPRSSVVEIKRNWAWQAVKYKNGATARKYALSTVLRDPFNRDSWRLMYCAYLNR